MLKFFTIILSLLLLSGCCSQVCGQDRENIVFLERYYNIWDSAYQLELVDNVAYVATGISGMQLVNVEDPENLEKSSYFDDHLKSANAICVGENIVFMTLSDTATGLIAIDISGHDNYRIVGEIQTPGLPLAMQLRDDYAYIADSGSGLVVIDVSDPENMEIVEEIHDYSNIRDVIVRGDIVYIADFEIGFVILSKDPDHNVDVLAAFPYPQAHLIRVCDSLVYLGHGQGELSIFDISNLNEPDSLTTINLHETIREIEVVNDVGFAAIGSGGIVSLNLADLSNPAVISDFILENGSANDLVISGDICYVADGQGLLWALDVSDPSEIDSTGSTIETRQGYPLIGDVQSITINDNVVTTVLLGSIELNQIIDDFGIFDRIVGMGLNSPARFVASIEDHFLGLLENNSMFCMNISEPDRCFITDCHALPGRPDNFVCNETYGFLPSGNSIFRMDYSNPNELLLLSDIELEEMDARNAAATDDFVYVVGEGGLWIFDIQDEDSFRFISNLDYPGVIVGVDIYEANLFVSYFDNEEGRSYFLIIDVEHTENPSEISRVELEGYPGRTVRIQSNQNNCLAYVCGGVDGGLKIIDVSDINEPDIVGSYDTPGEALDLVVYDNFIYVADRTNIGVYMHQIQNSVSDEDESLISDSFHLNSIYPNPFNPKVTINYKLQINDEINISIHDIKGRLIETLFNGVQPGGDHSITFHADDYPSGLYLAKIKTSTALEIHKLTLLR